MCTGHRKQDHIVFKDSFRLLLEGARASTGLCVDVSSGEPPGNDINESN